MCYAVIEFCICIMMIYILLSIVYINCLYMLFIHHSDWYSKCISSLNKYLSIMSLESIETKYKTILESKMR